MLYLQNEGFISIYAYVYLSNNKREQSSNWTVIIVWNLIKLYNGELS